MDMVFQDRAFNVLRSQVLKSAVPGNFQSSSNCFEILNSCVDEDQENISLHCDVIWGVGKNEFYEVLSAMKLGEKVRAALAEANYEQHLEQKLKETHELD